jgi:hypothetical protein
MSLFLRNPEIFEAKKMLLFNQNFLLILKLYFSFIKSHLYPLYFKLNHSSLNNLLIKIKNVYEKHIILFNLLYYYYFNSHSIISIKILIKIHSNSITKISLATSKLNFFKSKNPHLINSNFNQNSNYFNL